MFRSLCTGLFCIFTVSTLALELDSGGVSVDFSLHSENQTLTGSDFIGNGDFSEVNAETGLLTNWITGVHVHRRVETPEDPLEVRLRRLVSFNHEDGTAAITVPREAHGDDPENMPLFSSYYSQMVPVEPLDMNTAYVLKFRYRGKLNGDLPNVLLNSTLICLNSTLASKASQPADPVLFNVTPSGAWKEAQVEVVAPPETRAVRVLLRLYGSGSIEFDDVSLRSRKIATGVTVRGIPFSFIDNRFCLSEGQPGIMVFGLRNEPAMTIAKPVLKIWMPRGFHISDVQDNLKLLQAQPGEDGTLYSIDLRSIAKVIKPERYTGWNSPAVLVESEHSSGSETYTARYWYEDGDYSSEPLNVQLQIIPSVTAKTPTRFRSGVMFSRENQFHNTEAAASLADYYTELGFNSVHSSPNPFTQHLAQKNVLRYYQPFWLCNGYRLGTAPKPDAARFQFADGTYHTEGSLQGICPVEVYRRGDYFKQEIVEPLRELIVTNRNVDSIMPNWEPYMFDYKGCFCPRCKEEFIAYSGLLRERVENVWPRDVLVKCREKWCEFRSWQHGRLVVTLQETIRDLGLEAGIEANFIPELAWDALTERGSTSEDRNQYRPEHYLNEMPVIEPWGPYNFHRFLMPYEYNPGCHLSTYAAAKAQKDFLAARIRDRKKQPKLIAFPHGFQGTDWITEPEALAFETLSFFINGWYGSIAYRFPRGYDARWWHELANVNNLIATYEDYTFAGKRAEHDLELLTPVPDEAQFRAELDSIHVVRILPEIKKMSLVQSVEWRLGRNRLIAVANAWEHGEVFVRLKLKDLGWFGKYVVRQQHLDRHLLSPSGRTAWSINELRDGIIMHVGALRCGFLTVEPFDDEKYYGERIPFAELQKAVESRRPSIEAAKAADLAYLTDRNQAEVQAGKAADLSAIKPVKSNSLAITVVKAQNVQTPCVKLTNSDQQIIIDPSGGARIVSWQVNGTEFVHQNATLGLAVDGIWWPQSSATMFTQVYRFLEQKSDDDEISITFERIIGSESEGLEGVVVQKTFTIKKDLPGFKAETTFVNKRTEECRFSYRYHNMHTALELNDARRGWGRLQGETAPIKFERDFIKRFYRAAVQPDKELENAFSMEQVLRIVEPSVQFGAPWLPYVTEADFSGDLYGVCFWDSGKQSCSTFEPIWQRTILQPGEKWSAGLSFKFLPKE